MPDTSAGIPLRPAKGGLSNPGHLGANTGERCPLAKSALAALAKIVGMSVPGVAAMSSWKIRGAAAGCRPIGEEDLDDLVRATGL